MLACNPLSLPPSGCKFECGSSGASLSNKEPIRVPWICWQGSNAETRHFVSFRFVLGICIALPASRFFADASC
jgi:hypothetical protein